MGRWRLIWKRWAVAEVCRREKQRFLAVRVISDAVDEELPADVETVAQEENHCAADWGGGGIAVAAAVGGERSCGGCARRR